MACKGICEIKHYEFGWAAELNAEPSAGAARLKFDEIRRILAQYFQDLKPDGDCTACGEGRRCDPSVDEPAEWAEDLVELPEPIVAASGSHTYTLTGKIWLRAWVTEGQCAGVSEPDARLAPTPRSAKTRTFELKKTFQPKASAGRCGCRCDRQVYVFTVSDGTVITAKDEATPLNLTGPDLDAWLGPRLKEAFARDYPDKPLQACGGNCHCVPVSPRPGQRRPVPATLEAPTPLKITTPIVANAFAPDGRIHSYVVTGECLVTGALVKGVCVPRLELAPEEGDGGH